MNTRKEDVKTLQEMQKIKDRIDNLTERLTQLYDSEANIKINYDLYNTHNVEECNNEKENRYHQTAEAFIKKEKKTVTKLWVFPLISIAVAIAVAYFSQNGLLTVVIGALGFIIKGICSSIIHKRISNECDDEIKEITAQYEIKLKKASEDDKKEQQRYQNDLNAAREKLHSENQQERDSLEKEIEELENKFEEIQIISDDDIDNIPTLIKILESNRADNIKEALREMDEQNRRIEEEKRRKAEEEKRRKAEEAARLATLLGKVHIRIGSINTYSGNLQTVRNSIYFDGAHYGAGDATGNTIFQLSPGPHNVYAQLQEAGYLFTSPTQSFILPGNGDIYIKIMIKNARANIYLCNSMSELLET